IRTLARVVSASKPSWLVAIAAKETVRRLARWPRCVLIEVETSCNLRCPWCDLILDVSRRRPQPTYVLVFLNPHIR
ncbi:hypothetical protein J7M28_07100, partial [bacterium]|nr:hypothetical protein [bacterium]